MNAPYECPPELVGLRVLVVDDDKDAREMLTTLPSQCRAEVITAASAFENLGHRLERDFLVQTLFVAGVSDASNLRAADN